MYIKDFTEAPEPITVNNELNPKLWQNNKLIPEVRAKLLIIAKNFADFLKVEKLDLRDITISGSNAGYNYSDSSDIDLHLVADVHTAERAELYDAKKNHYNFTHDIKIHGIDVELYVQDSKQQHHSAGIYSVLNNHWISEPKRITSYPTHKEIKSKARNYSSRINQALRSNDLNTAKETMADIRRLRQAGLESGGESSVENLAFKLLRARGQIDKLRNHINRLQSSALSLGEKYES
jgi:hypothetical protein